MLEISPTPPLPTMPPSQDFSKLGFVYITVLGLANQVVPHTENWQSLATAVNYLARIVPIVYLAFQARPASPVGVQPDSGMGHDNGAQLWALIFTWVIFILYYQVRTHLIVVNATIHHVLILPSMGYFKEISLSFDFAL
ncbi:hypothetical protein DSO57_1009461 [Entomophthora muscae]|uniref:Uncharacterized protein n=1 Tax=Entomophthora muscae TaxID=34485 RepID=A0ACC2TI39_9FUNG|nr:hypothetical protein DSO57_1009461 [Entomophthora muscae]